MSVYSIARFQNAPPVPPFQLGGWFFREGERCFLSDARSRFQLAGAPALFAELRDGDQATVNVVAVTKESIECDKVIASFRSELAPTGARGKHAEDFARFVRMIRDFFVQHGLQEIETPTLVTCPGLEPHLEPFPVEIKKGRESLVAYLPTSPEIHLKKALAQGWTDIFEIKSCFRKGEFSPHHENEFHMLEWYRGFADLERITLDLRELLKECVRAGFTHGSPEPQVTTFKRLFHEILEFDLQPGTTREELRGLCDRLDIHALEGDSFNDLFHRLLIDKVEPKFKNMGPLIVRDFPPSQAALARLTPEGWADRFEFYWQGLEIANAFNEVTDAAEQVKRWQLEQDERLHLGTSEVPQDPALITALRRGIPPTGGIALGVERLYMACRGVDEIRELKLFSSDDLFQE